MNVDYLRVAIPPFSSPGLRVALGGEPIMNDQSLLAASNDNTISTKAKNDSSNFLHLIIYSLLFSFFIRLLYDSFQPILFAL